MKEWVGLIIGLCITIWGIGSLCMFQHSMKAADNQAVAEIKAYERSWHVQPLSGMAYHDKPGTIIGKIEVPKIGLKLPLRNGPAIKSRVDKGPTTVHQDEMDDRNVAIAGHKLPFGGIHFSKLNDLRKGDRVILEDHGRKRIYAVTKRLVTIPENVHVLDETNIETLTLITCHEYDDVTRTFKKRMVVTAERVSR